VKNVQNNKKNVNKKTDPRELVFDMLLSILRDGEYSHIVIRKALDAHEELDQKQKSFVKRLTEGCLEEKIRLEYVINQFSKLPVSKMKPAIRMILYMGTYQILFMDSVPDSATCNEAVKLAGKRKFQSLKGFVNGVLRNISRNKESIKYPIKEDDLVTYLSITYSMPKWLVNHFMKSYSSEIVESICASIQEEHKVTIRIDERLSDEEQNRLLCEIEEKGIQTIKHPYLEYAFQIKNFDGIKNVPGFIEGKITVQDVSSMLVSEIAAPKENDLVLDVCAAPGGKSMHIASKLKGTGRVIARDLSENKKGLIDENKNRMHLDNMRFEVFDALKEDPDMIEKADILLADLPCSGLGIIGKKRDIRYRVKEQDLHTLPKLQKQILQTVSKYVKRNGILVYSTCTINPEENEKIAKWIENTMGFKRESLNPFLCAELQSEEAESGMLQLLPGKHKTDGFFIAKFRKV
jgi:16S rRNA (cytosine967-C5)-methyltransferase